MKQKKSLETFSKMPVGKAVIQNAVPAMLSMLMVLIYNLADTFFIGQTHDDFQVAAVSLATPVFLIFMSVGTVFGIGGTSVISRALGEKKTDYAKKVCSFCMWSCVFVGIIMSAVFIIFIDSILRLIGTSADVWNYTKNYLVIVSFCGPFVLISNCFSNILRAEGQSVKAMLGMLLGNLLNVILDPIFILVFKMDIVGAAIATVIGNVIGAAYYILYYLKGESSLGVSIRNFTVCNNVCKSVLAIGIPASLGSALMSISQIIVNGQMAHYGDLAVAGIGVAMKITMITGMIAMGVGQGIQALLGYCAGANLWDRFKKIMSHSLKFAFALSAGMTALCYIFNSNIINVFLTQDTAFNYAQNFSKILLTTSALFGIFYVIINALQAMGAATESLVVNLSRQGIIYIPAIFLLQAKLGVTGLIWAQPVADILSLLLAVLLYINILRKTIYKMESISDERE